MYNEEEELEAGGDILEGDELDALPEGMEGIEDIGSGDPEDGFH